MEDKNEKTTNAQESTDPPTKCIHCGRSVGLFDYKRRTKDGIVCLSCDTTVTVNVPDFVLQSNVWAGEVVRKWINRGEVPDEQVTPNGVDLTIDKLLQQRGNVVLTKKKEDTDKGMLWAMPYRNDLVGMPGKEGWIIEPGYYTVQWAEHICIPSNAIGLLSPRSTLLRTCATVYGAVWDRGYHGIGQSGLHVFDYMILERGTALAQMCFIEASIGDKLYNGQYQNEGENVNAAKKEEEED